MVGIAEVERMHRMRQRPEQIRLMAEDIFVKWAAAQGIYHSDTETSSVEQHANRYARRALRMAQAFYTELEAELGKEGE